MPKRCFRAFYEIFSGTSWSHVWYLYLMIGIIFFCRSTTKIARRTARQGGLRYLACLTSSSCRLCPF